MDSRSIPTEVRGIVGGNFYGPAVGNVERDLNLDMRKFLTIVQVYLSPETQNQQEVIRWVKDRVQRWVPWVESSSRLHQRSTAISC